MKGRLNDFTFSQIAIQSDEDPLTGTLEKFQAILLDSGSFMIQAELYAPTTFLLLVDEKPLARLFLCPGENLEITADSKGIIFHGSTGGYSAWSQALRNDYLAKYSLAYTESKIKDRSDIITQVSELFELRAEHLSQVDKLVDKFALSECEYLFCKNEVNYAIYTYLWSDLLQRGYSIKHDVFQFMSRLRLDDTLAVRTSLSYNRALEVYLFLKLRLKHEWYDAKSFDPTSDAFNNLFYEEILTSIPNEEVKNGLLTRRIISLLNAGSTSADLLFKRYLNDCSDSFYRKVAFKYYNLYVEEKQFSDQGVKIEALQGALFEQLKLHKGKILYLDFWASWCGPCIQSFPVTVKLQEKYRNKAVEVIYVNIDDNIGAAELAARRLGLTGNIVYLDKRQSEEVRKTLQIRGIPHYTLVDKDGTIVDADAPHPASGTIDMRLNQLLEN